ncbi:MAG: hypothetical protein ACRDRL_01560 [Sciscionella sp.]
MSGSSQWWDSANSKAALSGEESAAWQSVRDARVTKLQLRRTHVGSASGVPGTQPIVDKASRGVLRVGARISHTEIKRGGCQLIFADSLAGSMSAPLVLLQ